MLWTSGGHYERGSPGRTGRYRSSTNIGRKVLKKMDKKEILGHIDHTLLKPYAVWEDIEKLCREAVEYGTASVCIPPCYVSRAHDKFETLNICTVVGFPLGYSVTAAKARSPN